MFRQRHLRHFGVLFSVFCLAAFSGEQIPEKLPAIALAPRTALRIPSKLKNDASIRGYRSETPRERAERDKDGDVPVGIEREAAERLVLKLATDHLNVKPGELQTHSVSRVWRGAEPTFVGWSIEIAQVHRGARIYTPPYRNFNGMRASVFCDDDWDFSVQLWDVTELGEAKDLIAEAKARELAVAALHVLPKHKHQYKSVGVIYYSGEHDRNWVLARNRNWLPAWLIEIAIEPELERLYSYRGANKGGTVILNAWTGAVIGGNPAEETWPADPSAWDDAVALPPGWDAADPVTRAVLDKLRIGQSEAETDAILKPISNEAGTLYLGGSGTYDKTYAINKDQELELHFGRLKQKFGLIEMGLLRKRTSWMHMNWEPALAELNAAQVSLRII